MSKAPPSEKPASSPRLSRVLDRVERQMQEQERLRQQEMQKQRFGFARAGMEAASKNDISGAISSYHQYLRLLELTKAVGPGGLTPSHFDPKTEVHEVLLLVGVYWDLARLYDRSRAKKKENQKQFAQYLERFVAFSKGMPFQALYAETLRKYIVAEKPVHASDFKNAYRLMGGRIQGCFVASTVQDLGNPETVLVLRRFRDEFLRRSPAGRKFIGWYYQKGPALAEQVEKLPRPLRRIIARGLDLLARLIRNF